MNFMHDEDALDYFYELSKKPRTEFVDEKYPEIKINVKFTPKTRGHEYSVYIIVDPRPKRNCILVDEIMYTWCGGYYKRVNKEPVFVEIDRDELLRTHRVAKR